MNNIEGLLEIIEQYEAKFVSLKYLKSDGELRQVDVAVNGLVIVEDYVVVYNLKLRPIQNRYFLDPFRSLPTIFCLCDNLNDQSSTRGFLNDILQDISLADNYLNKFKLELEVNFLVFNKSKSQAENLLLAVNDTIDYQNQVEPYDQLANLRTEIIDILEKIGIPTICHYHASKLSSCSIVIKAEDFLRIADCFVITYFIIKNVAESYGKTAFFFKDLTNNLYLLLPAAEYNKDLATLIIFNIMHNLETRANNTYFVFELTQMKLKKENTISDLSAFYDKVRNCYKVTFSLYQAVNPYLAIVYLIIESFGITDGLKKIGKQ